jgi:hypothetical protein
VAAMTTQRPTSNPSASAAAETMTTTTAAIGHELPVDLCLSSRRCGGDSHQCRCNNQTDPPGQPDIGGSPNARQVRGSGGGLPVRGQSIEAGVPARSSYAQDGVRERY